jgi:hypothetical protein
MATNTLPSPCPKSNLTRRAALHGAASVGALALPAGVALAIEATKLEAAGVDDPAFAAIVAEYEAAGEALNNYDGAGGESERKVEKRWHTASEALYRARPKTLPDLATQLRLINEEIGDAGGWLPDATSEHTIAAIADQLDALAGGVS